MPCPPEPEVVEQLERAAGLLRAITDLPAELAPGAVPGTFVLVVRMPMLLVVEARVTLRALAALAAM